MNRFRVLQFNMQFGQGWDAANPDAAPIDLDATVTEIRRHDADIIQLQEVEHAQPNGVQLAVPPHYTELQRALSAYDSYFALPKADPRELPFGVGQAIFSRTPLTGRTRRDLPSPPVHFDFLGEDRTPTDRLLIGARTAIAGRELQLFNTHLLAFFMLKSSSEEHGEQRAILLETLRQSPGPTLLSGDFNVSRHLLLAAQFAEVGYTTVQNTEPTWRRRRYVLDHIFYNAALRCVGYQVQPTLASDHHTLVADFEFVG
jgi:endonuclease/exonuclease/phosphatase family metal-dependent hydrolase